MPGVVLLYLGICCVLAGLALMLTWWRWRLHLFLSGLALIAVGLLLPAPEMRVAEPRTRLDRLAPAWQFNEVHSITVAAPCAKTWTAVKEVTAGEIKLFHTLTWIRRFGRPLPESILNAPPSTPILEVATTNRLSAVGRGSRARDRDRRDAHPAGPRQGVHELPIDGVGDGRLRGDNRDAGSRNGRLGPPPLREVLAGDLSRGAP